MCLKAQGTSPAVQGGCGVRMGTSALLPQGLAACASPHAWLPALPSPQRWSCCGGPSRVLILCLQGNQRRAQGQSLHSAAYDLAVKTLTSPQATHPQSWDKQELPPSAVVALPRLLYGNVSTSLNSEMIWPLPCLWGPGKFGPGSPLRQSCCVHTGQLCRLLPAWQEGLDRGHPYFQVSLPCG